LYANQLAWLNSRGSNRAKARRETIEYDMPDIGYCYWIFDLAIGFGLSPKWSELNAWNELTGANLNKFESKCVHMISVVYNNKLGEYDGTDSPRPYIGNTKQSADSIQNVLRNI